MQLAEFKIQELIKHVSVGFFTFKNGLAGNMFSRARGRVCKSVEFTSHFTLFEIAYTTHQHGQGDLSSV